MSELTTNGLLDDLTGGNVQTDHGGLTFADLVVLLLDLVLLLYTGWRSFDFLSTTVPDGWQVLALVGLWGLDIGAIAWSLVWIFGSTGKFQNWVSMAFFVIDLVGVALTSLTDSLMYSRGEGAMSQALGGVTAVAVPLVLFGNVVAGFIYHMTSPETKRRRKQRAMQAEHNNRMDQVADMEQRLTYTEAFLLARQDALDKAVILADLKVQQDAIERQTQKALRDKMKVHGISQSDGPVNDQSNAIETLKHRLSKIKLPGRADEDVNDLSDEESALVPILAERPDIGDDHPQASNNGGRLVNP